MRLWMVLWVGLGFALAQKPFLGASTSVFEGSFCKQYKCELVSRESVTSAIVEFRYRVLVGFGGEIEPLPVNFSIVRVDNLVASVLFENSGKVSSFAPESPLLKLFIDLVQSATGYRLSEKELLDFDSVVRPGSALRKEFISGSRRYALELVASSNTANLSAETFMRKSYRLYFP